jgi:hypothetical protein
MIKVLYRRFRPKPFPRIEIKVSHKYFPSEPFQRTKKQGFVDTYLHPGSVKNSILWSEPIFIIQYYRLLHLNDVSKQKIARLDFLKRHQNVLLCL